MSRTIDWSLKKVFIKEELDLNIHSGDAFLSWRRQFTNFLREAAIDNEQVPWETKMAAIEACVTPASYEKVTAAQLKLPSESRQSIPEVLDAIATLAKARDNVWIRRKAFDSYRQHNDQTFKEFYAEVVKLASYCEYGKQFCEEDKIRVIDQFLLMKLVLHTSDTAAQRRLMEEPDLNLSTAIRILENFDSLKNTTNALSD